MLRYIYILLIALAFAPPAFAQEKVFNAEYFTLENGMEIVVVPNNRAPVVTHMVWYRVGAADEPPGKSGIAHFLEHLMFKGSLGFGPGEFSKTIRALGGNDNAFTSQDFTAYFQSIASKHLELVMRMEAGRMRGLNPPLKEVDSERKVILEERSQRTDNNPRAKFAEPMAASLFVNHPYGTPIIGWAHEMEGLTWDDAKTFYDKYYGPNNAILVVAGDVTGEDVFELAKKVYGPIPKINLPERTWITSPPLPGSAKVKMEDEGVKQPLVQLATRAPSARQSKQESLALEVLEDILGNGPTSRLYKSIVVEQKLASQASLYYTGNNWDDAQFQIFATPLPGTTADQVKDALKAEIQKVIDNGVTNEELRDAKSRMQDAAIYARDSLTGPAMIIGRALISGSDLDDIEYWPRDIQTVTAKQVQKVASAYLDPNKNQFITGYLLPKEKESVE